VSDYPKLPDYHNETHPNPNCTTESWGNFSSETGYDSFFDLSASAKLMWTVLDDDITIKGRLAFKGIFGWLSIGFAHPTGGKNGMQGAPVIFAIPGGNFSAKDGLDLTMDTTALEYRIDMELSAFRHWSQPLHDGLLPGNATYSVASNECFTALHFQTYRIDNQTFKMDGWDDLIWAANGEDYFVAYHGREHRARFEVDWVQGIGRFPTSAPTFAPTPSPDSSSSKISSLVVTLSYLISFAAAVMILV